MRLDDLQPGDFIVVTDYQEADLVSERPGNDAPFGIGPWIARNPKARVTPPIDGLPLRVTAVSLPFIAVETPTQHGLYPVDVRTCVIRKVRKEYVDAMRECFARFNDAAMYDSEQEKIDAEYEKQVQLVGTASRICPMCNERMVELRTGPGVWMLHCKQCGFTGGKSPESPA